MVNLYIKFKIHSIEKFIKVKSEDNIGGILYMPYVIKMKETTKCIMLI